MELRAAGVLGRIRDVTVAPSQQQRPGTRPKVPDERPRTRTQDAADLGQAGRRVGPVVHREGTDDQIECAVGKWQGRHVPNDE
jgi:hypothetical protein